MLDFLNVTNPNVIAADEIDPIEDAPALSMSARTSYGNASGFLTVLTSFMTWEAWSSHALIQYQEYGLRNVPNVNLLLPGAWRGLASALVANDLVVTSLAGVPNASSNINVARSSLFGGYSLIVMGETFCEGVIAGGPPLTSAQVLDSAIVRFTRAIDVATAAGASSGEARDILNSALVGRARAKLQLGDRQGAAQDAGQVAAGWSYNLIHADLPSARSRVGNQQYIFTRDALAVIVPPAFRTGDPRVPYFEPGTGGYPTVGGDGISPFYASGKFTGYGSPVRLASRLEADYILAEANGTDAQLALIARERAANGQPPYAGPTDPESVLREFQEQRGREFYLEGKRLGDLRRNGAAVPHVPEPGTTFYRPGYPTVSNQTCLPLPLVETDNNPNFRGR